MNPYLRALRSIDALARLVVAPQRRRAMRRRGITIAHDVAYGAQATQRLDIYRPAGHAAPAAAVFYVHGGGFTALSKNTHVAIARRLVAQNVAVIVPDYHLAPEHPFPAALIDVATAWCHIVAHAAEYGLDTARIIVAGESAGANLALGLTLAACAPLTQDPAVAAVHAAGCVPRALMPLCGLLQVSDMGRYRAGTDAASPFVQARLGNIAAAYLGDRHAQFAAARALADPLVMLENAYRAERPLPPVFIGTGAEDPILPDSRRLAAALKTRGVPHVLHTYPEAGHAFFAVRNTPATADFWRDAAAFVATHAGAAHT